MPKPVLAVLVVLFLSLLLCAAFTEAGTSARGAAPAGTRGHPR
ncbi:hypothetical protein [Kitasatospora purpeofusca]|uniref:Uncharacterized protein n=1 Tax=Kitasatospora purpeofusca TaxID=67352 RepID=A0ABZ1TZT0_9ACTN|nr:hypothetical protein [Kitasatospora purpeofusca]